MIKQLILKIIRSISTKRYDVAKDLLEVERSVKVIRKDTSLSSDVMILCPMKNGEEYIPEFITYYRKMGIGNMVFMDNGSTDKTVDLLSEHEGVTILSCPMDFSKYEAAIRKYLIESWGKNRWTLNVDIDEFFDFPYSERIGLEGLISYLQEHEYDALIAQMVDVVPQGDYNLPNSTNWKLFTSSIDKQDFRDYCQHLIGYYRYPESFNSQVSSEEIPFLTGGIRKEYFDWKYYPLTKMPLLFFHDKMDPLVSVHFTNRARYADISGILYHHAFYGDYHARFKDRARTFSKKLEGYNRLFDLLEKGELPAENTKMEVGASNHEHLRESGIIHTSRQFMDYVNGLNG